MEDLTLAQTFFLKTMMIMTDQEATPNPNVKHR